MTDKPMIPASTPCTRAGTYVEAAQINSRKHKCHHPPKPDLLWRGPCRLAIDAPLHRNAFAFDLCPEIKVATDHDQDRSTEYIIRSQHQRPHFLNDLIPGPRKCMEA